MRETVRLSAFLVLLLALAAPAGIAAAPPFNDPITGSAHGAIFGPDGKQIDVTAEFIARAQAVYTAHALEGASAAQRARFESKRVYLDDLARGAVAPGDRQGALFARSLLLDWLIDEVAPADAAVLKARNRLLVSSIQHGRGYMDGQPYTMLAHEQAQLTQAGVLPAAAAAVGLTPEVLQARETYAKNCRKAGVPIPPTWGKNGAGLWNSNGVLAAPFISQTLKAEVFVYQSATPQGVCLALPRYGAAAGAPIEQLGIVCMGTGIDTGGGNFVSNACFWDNQLDKKSQNVPRVGEFPLNTTFAANDELKDGQGGICTACHAGENAYIVHPDDPAFQGIANLKPKAYYTPLVTAGWPLNATPNTKLAGVVLGAADSSCLDCHSAAKKQRIPEIVKELATPPGENYCDAVLLPAIVTTMPPGGPFPDPDYKKQNDFLTQACADAAK